MKVREVVAAIWAAFAAAVAGLLGLRRTGLKHPPLRPPGASYITPGERDRRFGPIDWVPAATSTNPEKVLLDRAPPLVRVPVPELAHVGITSFRVHAKAAPSLNAVLRDLRRDGKMDLIRSYQGGYYPRLVRGSKASLSSHSYGTAIDLNADENPLYTLGTPEQWELARYFREHGWYWGGWFGSRPDPHHFEFLGDTEWV